jgi:3-isopropylmalate/(R)-2-methylmalate dehydratase small subunit
MDRFTKLSGIAAPVPAVNVDTDMIIPKDYLKTTKRTGLGVGLFANARYLEDGSPNPRFILNKAPYDKATILITGNNFGCGSSREHAPWALLDFGIRCIISTSFAEIFYNNCFKNGILPVVVTPKEHALLLEQTVEGKIAILSIDLEKEEVTWPEGHRVAFKTDDFKRHCLLNGVDDIGLTLEKRSVIDLFEARSLVTQPWA